ncbi:ScbR family autoregulator-binding transcription factor [Streptomyces sp. O3]
MVELRQQRAVRTREVILQAAAEVFDELGYSGASISKIMDRAGVTHGSMYFHFKSKQALALAVMVNDWLAGAELPPGDDGLGRLVRITFHLSEQLQTNVAFRSTFRLAVEQGEFGLRQEGAAHERWAEVFHQQLVAARRRGELLDGVDEREFAQVLVGACTGTQTLSRIAVEQTADLPDRIAALWRYFLPGLATDRALAELRELPELGKALVRAAS